jgi:hypothetical protein
VSKWRDIYFKTELKKTWKEINQRQTAKQTIESLIQESRTEYPLRRFGWTSEGSLELSEENRASHIHIVGSTRQGKSKLLESFIRHDIDNGYGCTLLDPSENASTAHAVLRYCIKRNYHNVIWIDLNEQHVLPTINPLAWRGPQAASGIVASCMDAVRLLWGQTEWQATARIQTYLKAIFTALYFAKATIPDAVAFLAVQQKGDHNPVLQEIEYKRRRILDELHPKTEARIILEEVFTSRATFLNDFKPTIRRLTPFFDQLPKLTFGSTETPLDFNDIIRNKTCLLVNLDMRGIGGDDLRRLLGTFIINGLVNAISYLSKRTEWKGRHYLYMDEGGLFATRALADIMAYQGKSGFWATIAHHYYGQFEDPFIIQAIENLCHIKGMFFTGNPHDRERMVKSMYFGEMAKQAIDAAANLKKQQMMIRIGKEPAQVITVADVPDIKDITPEQLGLFKEQIYKANSFYRSPRTIEEEINKRFDRRTYQQPGGAPVRPQEHHSPRPAQKRGDDSHSTVQAEAPKPPRPSGQLPRKPKGQEGVLPSLVHKRQQDVEPLGGRPVEADKPEEQ